MGKVNNNEIILWGMRRILIKQWVDTKYVFDKSYRLHIFDVFDTKTQEFCNSLIV